MPTKTITLEANNIDDAAEQIIHIFEGTNKGGDVIYLIHGWRGRSRFSPFSENNGWRGWGASAVLKEVVKRLRSSLGSADTRIAGGLGKIIHIDFSRWQSKRALQKAIAEELELPQQVVAIFDQCDEEDDFDGVEQSARGVIPHVKVAILNELIHQRFLVVLHKGSGGYIDLREVGVPLIGELSKRVLWTSRGSFCPHVTARGGRVEDLEELAGLSDVAICIKPSMLGREHILDAEIEEVAKYTRVPEPAMSANIVAECIMYMAMAARGHDWDMNWESHASNYWVCDGIIQDATDGARSAWEISEALQRSMNLGFCNMCAAEICEILDARCSHIKRRWISRISRSFMYVENPSLATSFFSRGAKRGGDYDYYNDEATMLLKAGWSNLRVMCLSYCNFSFSSHPFLSFNNLRFLLLDHCKDLDTQDLGGEKDSHSHHHSQCSQEDNGACFRNLWVLELSYTDWYWLLSKDLLDLMAELRELNVKGAGNQSMSHLHRCSGAGRNNRNLIKLRVVADDSSEDDDGDGANRFSRRIEGVGPYMDYLLKKEHQISAYNYETRDKRRTSRTSPVVASSFPDLSSWHILKTVVLDGCGDLELIDCNALPQQSLESFTLNSGSATMNGNNNKIKRISFRGCAKLKSMLLRGSFDSLVELDMSGTLIKTLDLSATRAMGLRRLFLVGCEELRAILWPEKTVQLEVLRIDTTITLTTWDDIREEGKPNKQREPTATDNNASIGGSSSSTKMVHGSNKGRIRNNLDSYIFTRDSRLFRSLMHFRHAKRLHVEISSTGCGYGKQQVQAVNMHKEVAAHNLYLDDFVAISTSNNVSNSQASAAANGDNKDVFEASSVTKSIMWLWDCPPIPTSSDWAHCYISIQEGDGTQTGLLQSGTAARQFTRATTALPRLVNEAATTLHIHDSFSITCIPGLAPATTTDAVYYLKWNSLEWCRLERCPNIEGTVFTTPPLKQNGDNIFFGLQTFWASQLPKARYIWDGNKPGMFRLGSDSFDSLKFLHLDYCPRLVHVLPSSYDPSSSDTGLYGLETLEIVCCGDLREVFALDGRHYSESQLKTLMVFPRLKHIHLYELPKLQHVCGRRMFTPNLETVKIRGCWSLKHLPAVEPPGAHGHAPKLRALRRTRRRPTVDCEKDWWEGLEWDGRDFGHQPYHYQRTHSAYWNKTRLRTSLLK